MYEREAEILATQARWGLYRAVPDDGLALRELGLDHLGRRGAVVQTHPPVRDRLHGRHLRVEGCLFTAECLTFGVQH